MHTLVYTLNAFFGPDIGSFTEWLASFVGGFGSKLADAIHHPFYYVFILGLPLSFLCSWLSKVLLLKKVLDTSPAVPLTKVQCFLLVSAGSVSHFFLDHSFVENGHSSMYKWILSTGWWEGQAPVAVVAILCTGLLGGFIYINRVKPSKSVNKQSADSLNLIILIASLYCLWCASQIYSINPRRPAIGEEADLGVIIFLATFLFPPHLLCMWSMHPRGQDAMHFHDNRIY